MMKTSWFQYTRLSARINPYVVETRVFHADDANTMTDYSMAPCVAESSAPKISPGCNVDVVVFFGSEIQQPMTSQCRGMMWNTNMSLCFPRQIGHDETALIHVGKYCRSYSQDARPLNLLIVNAYVHVYMHFTQSAKYLY